MSHSPRCLPGPGNVERTIEFLKEIGFWHLSGYDGCLCGHIKILAFEIDVSCRKSGVAPHGRISVKSTYYGVPTEDLQKVANEVLRQYRLQEESEPEIILGDAQ